MTQQTLCCYDLIMVRSGEILTINGNFDGEYCRATLSLFPSSMGNRLIDGRVYKKATYELGYKIPYVRKILDLPGQQQFLVDRNSIVRVYSARRAFDSLSFQDKIRTRLFMDYLGLDYNFHGLTGSSASGCRLSDSDFDWVLYTNQLWSVKQSVVDVPRMLTFDMQHAYRKYHVFEVLSKQDIDLIFGNKWKYLWFCGLHISVNFVDMAVRADHLCDTDNCRDRLVLRGRVIDGKGSYYSPYVIPFESDGQTYQILTWLYLYNGAFASGDLIELSARIGSFGGQEYLVVERPPDYIRKLVCKDGGGHVSDRLHSASSS